MRDRHQLWTKNSSFSSGRVNGSPPETITSRISGWVRDVLDHPAVVSRDRVPAAALHRRALSGAEPAIHRADVRRDQQRAVRIAMGQSGDGRVLVLFEGVVLAIGSEAPASSRGSGIDCRRIGSLGSKGSIKREVIGRDRELVVSLQGLDRPPSSIRKGKQLARFAGGGGWRSGPASASRSSRFRRHRPRRGGGGIGLASNWEARRHRQTRPRLGWRRKGSSRSVNRPSFSGPLSRRVGGRTTVRPPKGLRDFKRTAKRDKGKPGKSPPVPTCDHLDTRNLGHRRHITPRPGTVKPSQSLYVIMIQRR